MILKYSYLSQDGIAECKLYDTKTSKPLASNLKVSHILDTRYCFSQGAEWVEGIYIKKTNINTLNRELKLMIDNPISISYMYKIIPINYKFTLSHIRGGCYEILNTSCLPLHILYKLHHYKTNITCLQ